jgi:hypothetical protein
MKPGATICLITPGHVSSTPRLVKEADALAAAGYRVQVVAGNHHPPAALLDASLLSQARWTYTLVRTGGALPRLVRKVLRKSAQLAVAAGVASETMAAVAHHADTLRFARIAASLPADLYVGHCLAGLSAAAFAARRRGVPYGFDFEDFHETETNEVMRDRAAGSAVRSLCRQLVPGCRHLTAASPLIGAACRDAYGATPITTLNVFPLVEAPARPVVPADPGPDNPMRFYWFSQTIGPGRGLEAVIDVLGRMKTPAELSLRGLWSDSYRHALESRAAVASSGLRIQFLASAPPAEMARLAAQAHVGLSVEDSTPPNRDICLPNKIFTYLLAGVPVALTPTRAQSQLARELGEAALLLDFAGRPAEVAATLDSFAATPGKLHAARAHAWALGQTRYNWDTEQRRFLDSIAAVETFSP